MTPDQEAELYCLYQEALYAESEQREYAEEAALCTVNELKPCAIGQSNTDTFMCSTLPYAYNNVLIDTDTEDKKSARSQQVAASDKYAMLGLKAFLYECVAGLCAVIMFAGILALYLAAFRPDLLQVWIGRQ